ncbi:MAG: tRNA (adenosine(37)-N6)-threonylcarbamoyltransferase complex transferase subunit TsaD [Clostridia bacterium]|nr:tRNA (adenosine(37)-N6)-threonylcarbamoyltransferase complex transferase subunit TsaD [Clostridia bacterium]
MNELKHKQNLTVLAIESSCDETACAVLCDGMVLSSVIASQIEIHRRFGGVVPEIASRNHTMSISTVVSEALEKSGIALSDIDAIAVTYGAGLVGALLVGVSFAKGLAYSLEKPLVGVNHIRGHVAANYIAHPELRPPYVSLIVSGGHTAVAIVRTYSDFEIIGSTCDDAAGEAFDKVARILGLPYPGGPEIEKLALSGKPIIPMPLAKTNNPLDFSYSGLKTAVINYVHNIEQKGESCNKADVAASFQQAALKVLIRNAVNAAVDNGINIIAISGGVGANSELRHELEKIATAKKIKVFYPPLSLCTDNAAMIGMEATVHIREGRPFSTLSLDAKATIPLNKVF